MNKQELLYKFLSGGLSRGSYRKYLLNVDNDDRFFTDTDFRHLKTLAITFSNPAKIKNILLQYADIAIVEQLTITTKFNNLLEKEEDILIKLDKLEALGEQQKNKSITDFAKPYKGIFRSTPRLAERAKWNEEIFMKKRKDVEKHQEEISRILEFSQQHYFEYKLLRQY